MSLIKYIYFMLEEYEVEVYSTAEGYEPFTDWLEQLKDHKVKCSILVRIQRMRQGNFGDCKHFEGLHELRIHVGPGFRVYCATIEKKLILLLGGGDKNTQDKDIKKCKKILESLRGIKK